MIHVETRTPPHAAGRWIAGLLAIAFGLATLRSGSEVLFGGPEARAGAGNVVQFVLVFNVAAAFAYLVAGAGTVLARRWAFALAASLAVSTALVFVVFGGHIAQGGAFETRTVVAMTVRTLFWLGQAVVLRRLLPRRAD